MARVSLMMALLCLLATPAVAGDLATLDEQNGYGGLTFGSSLDSAEEMRLINPRGSDGTRIYSRDRETLKFGDAVLDGVNYGYHQDRLYFVALFTTGRSNTRALLKELRRVFGPGKKVTHGFDDYVWTGKRVKLHYREDPVTHMGLVGFTSIPIDLAIRESRRGDVAAKSAP